MDDGYDELATLLTSSWDETTRDHIRHSRETHEYLDHVTSLPLSELLEEPRKQRRKQESLTENAQKMAFREYPAFLQVQQCRQQMHESLRHLHDHLGSVQAFAPDLEDACRVFEQEAKAIAQERSRITNVLEHNDMLTDIFEIPQLMDTCVRNRYYNDALNLASHVRLLLLEYPLPVIRTIQDKVQASSDLMLVQLLSQLRGPIKLVDVTKVIFFLRRMDVFASDAELPMVFLKCRHDFVEQRLSRIRAKQLPQPSSNDASAYLKDYIGLMREQMLDIAQQYTSVFSHDKTPLLADFMVQWIMQMQTTLADALTRIDDTSKIESLHLQLQHCGLSLGRIGLDFRPLFSQLFLGKIAVSGVEAHTSPCDTPSPVTQSPDSSKETPSPPPLSSSSPTE